MSAAGTSGDPTVCVVGRADARRRLRDFLERARREPAALVLEGEPGIGKTALWQEALQQAADLTTLVCRPTQAEQALPFAGLGDLLAGVADDVLPALPVAQRLALDVALCRTPPGAAGVHALAASHGLLSALRLLAQERPVLVAVDDLQWLDAATAQAVAFALRRVDAPVSLLATRRAGGSASPADDLPSQTLQVGSLDLDEVEELLQARLGERFRLPALLEIHRSSGGNPLHAVEVARAALDSGTELHPGRPLPVPPDLASLLRGRVRQLPPGSGRTLALMAALAQPTVELLTSVVGSRQTVLEHVGAAQEAGVVITTGARLRFAHPLYGSALLEDLDDTGRCAVHRELAGAVADPVERSRHLALAATEAEEATAAAVEDGALLASSRGAPAEAAELTAHALRLTPAGGLTARAVRAARLALHHQQAGTAPSALPMLTDVLAQLPPGPRRVPLLLRLAFAHQARGAPEARWQAFDSALQEAAGDADASAQVRQVLAWELAATGHVVVALEHARACAELAQQVRVPRVAAGCRAVAALVEFMAGNGRDESLRAAPAPTPVEPIWSFPDAADPTWAGAVAAMWADDYTGARAHSASFRASAQQRSDLLDVDHADWIDAFVDQRRGAWASARAYAHADLARGARDEQVPVGAMALWFAALVEAHLGEVEQARAHAELGHAQSLASGQRFSELQCAAVLGFLDLSLGDVTAAWDRLAPLPEGLARLGYGDPGFLRCTADAVEAAVGVGELAAAERLLDALDEQASRSGSAWGAAAVARGRGLLLAAHGDLPAAAAALEQAVALHEPLGQPFELARTLLAAGGVARRRKAKAESAALLARARELFEGLPAPLWAARAAAEADRLGGRASSPFALTETERRVAELAAQGRSNAEAAAALFVSIKTVEWNLSKVYRKTGVRSRAELAARWPL